MKVLAITFGCIIGVIGIVGIVAPSVLLEFGRSLQTPTALYVVAAVRIVFGVVLVRVAPISRMPKTFRVIGIFIIVVGVLTPFFGVERSRAMLEWWSAQGSAFTRLWAGVVVAFGVFIVYAITSSRRTAA